MTRRSVPELGRCLALQHDPPPIAGIRPLPGATAGSQSEHRNKPAARCRSMAAVRCRNMTRRSVPEYGRCPALQRGRSQNTAIRPRASPAQPSDVPDQLPAPLRPRSPRQPLSLVSPAKPCHAKLTMPACHSIAVLSPLYGPTGPQPLPVQLTGRRRGSGHRSARLVTIPSRSDRSQPVQARPTDPANRLPPTRYRWPNRAGRTALAEPRWPNRADQLWAKPLPANPDRTPAQPNPATPRKGAAHPRAVGSRPIG